MIETKVNFHEATLECSVIVTIIAPLLTVIAVLSFLYCALSANRLSYYFVESAILRKVEKNEETTHDAVAVVHEADTFLLSNIFISFFNSITNTTHARLRKRKLN